MLSPKELHDLLYTKDAQGMLACDLERSARSAASWSLDPAHSWTTLPLLLDRRATGSPLHLAVECADLGAEELISDALMPSGQTSSLNTERRFAAASCSWTAASGGISLSDALCVLRRPGLALFAALIRLGVEVDALSSRGETALGTAARLSNRWAVQALLEAGADPTLGRQTPLMHAIANHDEEAVALLLTRTDARAAVHATNPFGMTAAQLSAIPPVVGAVLDACGAECDAQPQPPSPPLREAAAPSPPSGSDDHGADGGDATGDDDGDDGGGGWWRPSGAGAREPSPCDFRVVDAHAMDPARLASQHVVASRPVLLRGGGASSHLAPLREAWRRGALLAAKGAESVTVGAIPFAAQFGQRQETMTLRRFVEAHMGRPPQHGDMELEEEQEQQQQQQQEQEETEGSRRGRGRVGRRGGSRGTDGVGGLYLFEAEERLLRSSEAPQPFLPTRRYPAYALGIAGALECGAKRVKRRPGDPPDVEEREACWARVLSGNGTMDAPALPRHLYLQIFAGGDGSGSQAHFHTHALNFLVFGRKEWRLQPPSARAYFDRRRATQPAPPRTFECTQQAGDVLFVPALWSHATDNVGDVLGFAMEFGGGVASLNMEAVIAERFASGGADALGGGSGSCAA